MKDKYILTKDGDTCMVTKNNKAIYKRLGNATKWYGDVPENIKDKIYTLDNFIEKGTASIN